jgi:hypothetical protein
VAHRHLGEQFECQVVDDLAVLHDPAVTVIHVLAQADVGDHDQVGRLVFDGAHGELHDALGVVGAARRRVLVRGDAEQEHRRYAEALDLAHLGQQVADRKLLAAGHGGDGPLDVLTVRDEQRVDEVVGREGRLAHHAPQRGRAPHAPHAIGGKVHVIRSFHEARRGLGVNGIYPPVHRSDKAAWTRRRSTAL